MPIQQIANFLLTLCVITSASGTDPDPAVLCPSTQMVTNVTNGEWCEVNEFEMYIYCPDPTP